MNLPPKDYTEQENIIAECLSEFGLRYEQQADFAPYSPDFYIPELGMIIEADGKYGHLRKKDAERDARLSKQEDVQCILHVRESTKEKIKETLMKRFNNL